jgi:hypothetical protein
MGMAMPVVVRVAVPKASVVVVMRIVVPVTVVPVTIVLPMGMLVAMLMATVIVLFHRSHLTSVAQVSAYAAVAANMGALGTITKGRPTGRPIRANAGWGPR